MTMLKTPKIRWRKRSKDKSTYEFIIYWGIDPVGNARKEETFTKVFDSDEEANRELDILRGKYAAGSSVPTNKITTGAYFTQWLNTPEAKKLAPKTYERNKGCIELRIVPWLGSIKLYELTASHLDSFFARMVKEGSLTVYGEKKSTKPITKESLKKYLTVISCVLEQAIRKDRLITVNVAKIITLPETLEVFDPDKEIVKVFSEAELQVLDSHLPNTQYYEICALALRTGMRRGELLALTWDCIDWDNSIIHIKQALTYTKEKGYQVGPTKNKKRRRIDITDEAKAILKVLLIYQELFKQEEELIEKAFEERNLVFCREDGYYHHPDSVSTWFPKFCTARGISGLTFHCMRHTHASHLLAAKEEISYVSARLGHSDVTVTYQKYSHFIPIELRKSLKDLEAKFNKRKK
jgi:integrase